MKQNDGSSTPVAKSTGKYHGLKGRGIIHAFVAGSTLFALLLLSTWRHDSGSISEELRSTNLLEAESIKSDGRKKDWSHCLDIRSPSNSRLNVQVKDDERVEPLWLPAYPTSLPAMPYSDLVTALTGIKNGAKSYYRSSPSLKRCHGTKSKVDAVTCEIVHPIVPAVRPHPSSQADNFGKVVLLALRNPLTAFPAFHQSKAELYHGQKGQVDESEWIKFRDQYVGNDNDSHLFNEWKNFIMEWRDMKPYYVGGYLPFEYWTDDAKGPELVGKLSKILNETGFSTLHNEGSGISSEMECLWYRHMCAPMLEDEKSRSDWYVPKFTDKQKDTIVAGLDQFAREIEHAHESGNTTRPSDNELIVILRDYMKVIRQSSDTVDVHP